jgi:tetratricopeptide (TPR) repeat protein
LISLAGAVFGGALLALVLVATPLGARLLGTVELSANVGGDESNTPRLEQSAQVRVSFYRMALEIVRERPILGYGPDNFVVGVPKYRTDSEPSEVQLSLETSAHGWLSQVAATIGLAGVGTFLGMVLLALAAFLGAGITTVDEVGTDWLLWMSLGIVGVATARPWVAARTLPQPNPGRGSKAPVGDHFVPTVVGYVCVSAGIVLALTTVSALGASHSAHASQQERLIPHKQQAIDLALNATSADPRRAAYWNTLGLAYVGAGRPADAVVAFKRASDLAPYDVRYLGDLARGYLELVQQGDASSASRARAIAERTVEVDPNQPQAQLTRAVVMQVIGDMPEALRSVERAVALDPNSTSPQLYLTATQVFYANGRFADAIAIARQANGILSTPNTVPIRVELARALIAAGQPSQALAELDIALSIRPNDPAALQLRAQIRSGSSSQ